MKKHLSLSLILLLGAQLSAQIDRTQQPKPGPTPLIQLESPEEFRLKNGLTVLLVENHKLPQVSISLSIDHPLLIEGNKAGTNSLLTSMMGKGSKSITKNEFEEEIDFMGTHFHFNPDGAHASSLTRYFPRVLELLADATLNPNFLEEEFEKEKDKTLTAIEASKKDVKTAARRVEDLVSYGEKHPYGEYVSKETVEQITLSDIKKAYFSIYNPVNSYIAIVGDFKTSDVKKQIKKHFADWKKREKVKVEFPEPTNSVETEIIFVDMPNAVQSEIAVLNTTALDKNNPDYFAAILANQILGGGGEARLFLNLREDKGYTYGAYSRMSDSHKTKALFKATTSVRNAVSDSAVVEMIYEVDRIGSELVTDEELEIVKAKYAGNFVISLEDPETIANFALNIKTQNLDPNFYKNYLKNINAVSKEDIFRVAKKYFKSDQAKIVVTGKGSDILDALEEIPYKGKKLNVSYYDQYGNPIDRPNYSMQTPDGITANTVIESYLEAMGGREKLNEVYSLIERAEATMQGMNLEIVSQKNNQYQAITEMKMMGNLMQKQVVNKDKAYMEMQGQRIDFEGQTLEDMIQESVLFSELNFDSKSIQLKGIVDIEGKKAYEIKISDSKSNFYDTTTYFKIQTIQTQEIMGNSQTSTIKFGDYQLVNGIYFPHTTTLSMGPQEIDFKTTGIEINTQLDETLFQ
jgi:predicted Zn-dependent peptidase